MMSSNGNSVSNESALSSLRRSVRYFKRLAKIPGAGEFRTWRRGDITSSVDTDKLGCCCIVKTRANNFAEINHGLIT